MGGVVVVSTGSVLKNTMVLLQIRELYLLKLALEILSGQKKLQETLITIQCIAMPYNTTQHNTTQHNATIYMYCP